jgi:hypothetical protein
VNLEHKITPNSYISIRNGALHETTVLDPCHHIDFDSPLWPQKTSPNRTAGSKPNCDNEKREAFLSGLSSGVELFSAHFKRDTRSRIPINIVVEQFENTASAKRIVAEMVKGLFDENFYLDEGSDMYLYISGTDSLGSSGVQSFDVSMEVQAQYRISTADGGFKFVQGNFQVAKSGSTASGNADYKEKVLKDHIFRVLDKTKSILRTGQ